jgi:hypothetical protein
MYIHHHLSSLVSLAPSTHSYSEPDPENYKIGLLIDPCKGNDEECCMNIYVPKYVLGDEREILENAELVDEFGAKLNPTVM